MFIDDDPFFKLALGFVAFIAIFWAVSTLVDYFGGSKNDKE